MSKQRTDDYEVYYGTDHNAALKPQYIRQKQNKKRNSEQREREREAKKIRRAEVKSCVITALVIIAVAAFAFGIVSRNALIYSNRNKIRDLAREKESLEVMIHTAEKDSSAGSELNSYFDIADSELKLSYPEQDRIVTVTCAAPTADEAVPEYGVGTGFYDTVLEWLSSVERGIRSWG